MSRLRLLNVFAACTLLAVCSNCYAVRITGVNLGASTGLGTAFTLNSAPVVVTGAENDANGANAPLNTILIDLNILQKHVPFSLVFNVAETTSPTFFNATEYLVTIITTHAVTGGSPANTISGFDIQTAATGANLAVSIPTNPPAPTSDFTVEFPNLPTGFRFGGLNGGGTGQLLMGDSATSTIPLSVVAFANTTGTVSLTMTANPEPTTVLLGSMALCPLGVVVWRRRRQKMQPVVEA